MSECLLYTDGLRLIEAEREAARKRAFEAAGGVGDPRAGARDEVWETMSNRQIDAFLAGARAASAWDGCTRSQKEIVELGRREPVRFPTYEDLVRMAGSVTSRQ